MFIYRDTDSRMVDTDRSTACEHLNPIWTPKIVAANNVFIF